MFLGNVPTAEQILLKLAELYADQMNVTVECRVIDAPEPDDTPKPEAEEPKPAKGRKKGKKKE